MKTLLLTNATVVNEGQAWAADLLIRGDRIERIGPGSTPGGAQVVDLSGCHILPGIIDDQVHFREPGLTHKADIGSESKAAICGGVTSYLDMPNNSPPCIDLNGLEFKRQIAARSSYANYGFYLGATNTNIAEIRRLKIGDACGIKVFMCSSTGNMLVDDEDTLRHIFADAAVPVVTHCEDTPMIQAAELQARERYGENVPLREHPMIRSAEACFKSSSLAVRLAREYGTRLHVLHLTTAREMELFERGPIEDKRITAEVCIHHLWYDESDYAELGSLIKCNPAIKTRADRDALRAAVQNDRIDIIATDHAPHTREEKAMSYFEAPSGLPLVQHMLPMMLELCREGVLSLPGVARKAAHNPASLFGIRDRGFLREGYLADLAIVDLNATTRITAQQLKYKCGWSPLEGSELHSSVIMTVLGGEIVYDHGQIREQPAGQLLEFA
jgi:dihydroorotase